MNDKHFEAYQNLENAWFTLLKTGIVSDKLEDCEIEEILEYFEARKIEIKSKYSTKARAKLVSSFNQFQNSAVVDETKKSNILNLGKTNTSYATISNQETQAVTHSSSYSEIKEPIVIKIQSFLSTELTRAFNNSLEKIRNEMSCQNICVRDMSQNVIFLVYIRPDSQSLVWEVDDYIKKNKIQSYVVIFFTDLYSPGKLEESTFEPFKAERRICCDYGFAFKQQFGGNGLLALLRDCVHLLIKIK